MAPPKMVIWVHFFQTPLKREFRYMRHVVKEQYIDSNVTNSCYGRHQFTSEGY